MDGRQGSSSTRQCRILFLVPLFFSVYMFCSYLRDIWKESKKPKPNPAKNFQTLFETHIKNVFSNQSIATMSKIKVQTLRALSPNSCEPMLLLFLTPQEARCTALNLAKRLAQIIISSLDKTSKSWEDMDAYILPGACFIDLKSPWNFYDTVKARVEKDGIIIIPEFELIHPHSSAIFTYLSRNLFYPSKEVFIFLIVDIPKEYTVNAPTALNYWATQSLFPYFDCALYQEVMRGLYLRTCLIKKEDFHLMG